MEFAFEDFLHLRSTKQGCSGPVPYHSVALRMPQKRPECCASTRSLAASRIATDQRARISFTYTRPNSALGPFQSSPQQRRAACYTPRAAAWRARQLSSLPRRHHRGLLRALLVAAAECDHTACFARAVVGSGVQNLQRVTHARAAALTALLRFTPPQQRAAACAAPTRSRSCSCRAPAPAI